MLYYFDANGRYTGCRARIGEESIPDCATETPVTVLDAYEAYYINGAWTVTEIPPASEAPESEPTEIEQIKAQNVKLEEMLAQTNADFASFMDYYFSINPE